MMMPFAFSIAQGIVFGMLSFVILKVLSGQMKQILAAMWVIFVLFIVKMVLDGMHVI
ncbi:MAG: hypothetical protein PHH64_03805 [Proteiniphilum sp.]|nr:hypothetical protein [Proteiniphilum sp.]